MLPAFYYHQPESVEEATALLSSLPGNIKILAGGTDLVPALRRGDLAPEHVVSLKHLSGLKRIEIKNGIIRIGPLITFSELARPELSEGPHSLLAEAALQVGGPQIRNQGTLGGNIVNASPAGDLLPPLLALDARVRVSRKGGDRVLPLDEFIIGPGKTAILPQEILSEVFFPALPESASSSFVKLGRRNSLAISRISLAAILVFEPGGAVAEARIALGSVATKPIRVPLAESLLKGRRPGPALLEEAIDAVADTVAASLGSRASAPYKRVAVRGVAREALVKAAPAFGGSN